MDVINKDKINMGEDMSMGKVAVAKTCLRAWGLDKYLDTRRYSRPP